MKRNGAFQVDYFLLYSLSHCYLQPRNMNVKHIEFPESPSESLGIRFRSV